MTLFDRGSCLARSAHCIAELALNEDADRGILRTRLTRRPSHRVDRLAPCALIAEQPRTRQETPDSQVQHLSRAGAHDLLGLCHVPLRTREIAHLSEHDGATRQGVSENGRAVDRAEPLDRPIAGLKALTQSTLLFA